VRIGAVSAYSEACVEKENAAIRPRRQETGKSTVVMMKAIPILWLGEIRIILFQTQKYVFQTGRRGRWRTNRKSKAMGLVDVVIWILPKNDNFDPIQRSMSRPRINFLLYSISRESTSFELPGGKTF